MATVEDTVSAAEIGDTSVLLTVSPLPWLLFLTVCQRFVIFLILDISKCQIAVYTTAFIVLSFPNVRLEIEMYLPVKC